MSEKPSKFLVNLPEDCGLVRVSEIKLLVKVFLVN